ncbi:hypothetical protein ES695_12535 [Candidatus Atribacteria bacterium 1244-E10-H5-B2]|nr:MAG: hypothetical protein ES695_12535 [Candidatus Atribacteria bacterium 1244-E10-H5-B2]
MNWTGLTGDILSEEIPRPPTLPLRYPDSEDPQSIESSRTGTTGLNLAQNGSISLDLPLELKTLAFLVSSSLPSSSI